MHMDATGTITTLLVKVGSGDPTASNALFDHVYKDLRRIAASILAKKGPASNSVSRTALVHAACERLLEGQKLAAENRKHFFFLFSRAMRDYLVEQARSDLALKRGGGRVRVPLGDLEAQAGQNDLSVLEIHDALEELQKLDEDSAETIMLKVFGGRTLREIVEFTGRSFATVRRDWDYGRAWLHERLSNRTARGPCEHEAGPEAEESKIKSHPR